MKLGIIGIGKVGSQFLTDIQYMNLFSKIVVIDSNAQLAEGEVLDHHHAQGLSRTNHIDICVGTYNDFIRCRCGCGDGKCADGSGYS